MIESVQKKNISIEKFEILRTDFLLKKKKRRKTVDKFNGCAKCNQLCCVVHGAYGNFGINGSIDKTTFSVHS